MVRLAKGYLFALLIVAVAAHQVAGDVYLHNPWGTNNRNAEKQENRANPQRCFDSENNGKGGYGRRQGTQTAGTFYAGSELYIEWTNQHSCNHENNRCNLILDYMLGSDVGPMRYGDPTSDGQDTATLDLSVANPETDPVNADRCLLEPLVYYRRCHAFRRNPRVWTAQENVCNSELCTRQNTDGQQHGSECASMRDYYPYWGPTPWRDIAVMGNSTMCRYWQSESQNVKEKYYCNEDLNMSANLNNRNAPYIDNNEKDCAPGKWIAEPAWGIDPPDCIRPPVSRDNHLGNVQGNGQPGYYNWTIPTNIPLPNTFLLRVRYNISTGDMTDSYTSENNIPEDPDEAEFFKRNNDGDPQIVLSPSITVQLSVNPQQFGRVFQDRTWIYDLINPVLEDINCNRIVNINVRGGRGNIVQSYPAVEYDFVPTNIRIDSGDCIHIQWHGTDAYANNRDGQGANKDANNLAQMPSPGANRPSDMEFWDFPPDDMPGVAEWRDMAIRGCGPPAPANPGVLDNAPFHCNLGLVRLTEQKEYFFMNTRNNSFSNRSQKLHIVVGPPTRLSPVAVAVVALAISLVAIGAALAVGVVIVRRNPGSKLAGWIPTRFGAAATGVATKNTNAAEFRKPVSDPGASSMPSPFDAPSVGGKRPKPPSRNI